MRRPREPGAPRPRTPRPGPTIDDDPRWAATSPDRPCPVCGDTDRRVRRRRGRGRRGLPQRALAAPDGGRRVAAPALTGPATRRGQGGTPGAPPRRGHRNWTVTMRSCHEPAGASTVAVSTVRGPTSAAGRRRSPPRPRLSMRWSWRRWRQAGWLAGRRAVADDHADRGVQRPTGCYGLGPAGDAAAISTDGPFGARCDSDHPVGSPLERSRRSRVTRRRTLGSASTISTR
jgi:hypothetical protein